jgi:hypothetical protein
MGERESLRKSSRFKGLSQILLLLRVDKRLGIGREAIVCARKRG